MELISIGRSLRIQGVIAIAGLVQIAPGVQAAVPDPAHGHVEAGTSAPQATQEPDWGEVSWREKLHLDATASWGLSNSAIALDNGSKTLSQLGMGVTVGWKIDPGIWVGVSSDFRSAGLSADLLSAVSEVEGSRWNYLSPAVGLAWGQSLLKADVILTGAYQFARSDGSESFSLRSPRGLRMTYLHPMVGRFHAGMQGEVTSWGERETRTSLERLMQREILWQASLTAAWVF
jgi:hypothetical protein